MSAQRIALAIVLCLVMIAGLIRAGDIWATMPKDASRVDDYRVVRIESSERARGSGVLMGTPGMVLPPGHQQVLFGWVQVPSRVIRRVQTAGRTGSIEFVVLSETGERISSMTNRVVGSIFVIWVFAGYESVGVPCRLVVFDNGRQIREFPFGILPEHIKPTIATAEPSFPVKATLVKGARDTVSIEGLAPIEGHERLDLSLIGTDFVLFDRPIMGTYSKGDSIRKQIQIPNASRLRDLRFLGEVTRETTHEDELVIPGAKLKRQFEQPFLVFRDTTSLMTKAGIAVSLRTANPNPRLAPLVVRNRIGFTVMVQPKAGEYLLIDDVDLLSPTPEEIGVESIRPTTLVISQAWRRRGPGGFSPSDMRQLQQRPHTHPVVARTPVNPQPDTVDLTIRLNLKYRRIHVVSSEAFRVPVKPSRAS